MVNETKREKFVRIAEARTNKILNMIQLLGNCSNQKQYEYTQKNVIVNKIVKKEVNLPLSNREDCICIIGKTIINGYFQI